MRSFSFHLYVLLCLFLFSSYIIDMNAQNNVPKVTCIYCGGTGRAGYSFCLFCGGSGLMVDPQYQNQKAADYGKSLGLCLRGQMKLIEGDYSEAFDAFREAMRLENAEAMFFVGACCELGMGVDVDLDLAKECYSLGSEYGNLNANDEAVYDAAIASHVDHFIRTMPEGYDMILNEESDNVSAGQKQLLTIARVILANPKILILDEATSSIDTRTEIQIQSAMDNLMKGRTRNTR